MLIVRHGCRLGEVASALVLPTEGSLYALERGLLACAQASQGPQRWWGDTLANTT